MIDNLGDTDDYYLGFSKTRYPKKTKYFLQKEAMKEIDKIYKDYNGSKPNLDEIKNLISQHRRNNPKFYARVERGIEVKNPQNRFNKPSQSMANPAQENAARNIERNVERT